MNGTAISIDQVKLVLQSLKNSKSNIKSTYNNDIRSVLQSSQQCLAVSGVNYTQLINILDEVFKTIDTNFDGLIDVLENKVISGYTDLSFALTQLFNNSLGSQLSSLLNIR